MSTGELIPLSGVLSAEWNLIHRQSLPTSLSGKSIAVDYGEPYWSVTNIRVEFTPDSALARQWAGFIRRRKGRSISFTMPRYFRPLPLQLGNISDDGLSVTSNRAASTVTLSGLENGYVFSEGDMVSFFTSESGYWIGEVTQTQASSGGSATVSVEPPPFDPHPSEANPRRIKAVGEFRLSDVPNISEAYNAYGFSFSANQLLRG